jgi:hypothetical protein
MQALPFQSAVGLALTFLASPPMDVGIPIETCKKKSKHMIVMQNLDCLPSDAYPSNFKYRDLKQFYATL